MKKRIAICMCLVLSLTVVLSSCKSKNASGSNTSEVPYDKSDKLQISWAGNVSFPSGQEGSYIEKVLEDKYNIEIKPMFLDSNAYKTKRPIMLASGEIPDVIYEADPVDMQRDASQGFLMEFSLDNMKKNAPDYYNFINENAFQAWAGTVYNGKIYGFPTTRVLSDYPSVCVWRKDWLDKVGIAKTPESIEEFEVAFDKFKNNDPDNNGKNDTFAMSGDIKNWYSMFTEFFGAYGALPFDWVNKDGKIVWGGVLPETKNALEQLAKWYKSGYIHPDFVTDGNTPEGLNTKMSNSNIGYVSGANFRSLDLQYPNSIYAITKAINPKAELVFGVPPKGPSGAQGRFSWGAGGNIYAFGKQVAKTPQKMARILTMFNDMLTDEDFYVQTKAGKQGEHWDYKNTSIGKQSGIKPLPPYDSKDVSEKNVLFFDLTYVSYWSPSGGNLDTIRKYMSKDETDYYEKYAKKEFSKKDVFMKPDVVPSSSRYINDLRNYELTTFTEIIKGDKDISYFDTFVKDWNKKGGEQYTNDANRFYSDVDKTVMQKIKK